MATRGRGPLPGQGGRKTKAQRTGPAAAAIVALPDPGDLARAEKPELDPGRDWDARTARWWDRLWSSPIAAFYLESDVDMLLRLAILVDMFYAEPDTKLAGEIRLQEARFVLSPAERLRVGWKPDEPKRERVRRTPDVSRGSDPYAALK